MVCATASGSFWPTGHGSSRGRRAVSFKVSWADVYSSVQWVVDYGLKHRVLENILAIGVDEVCVRVGRVFWTLVYQIDTI